MISFLISQMIIDVKMDNFFGKLIPQNRWYLVQDVCDKGVEILDENIAAHLIVINGLQFDGFLREGHRIFDHHSAIAKCC